MSETTEKYSVTQYSVNSVLSYISAGDIAIPEIQRPFVWKGRQVRDLIDSLYNGYPTGYLIIWQNPDVKVQKRSRSARSQMKTCCMKTSTSTVFLPIFLPQRSKIMIISWRNAEFWWRKRSKNIIIAFDENLYEENDSDFGYLLFVPVHAAVFRVCGGEGFRLAGI